MLASMTDSKPSWPVPPLTTIWDDLLENIDSPEDWEAKRHAIRGRFLDLIGDDTAPAPPDDFDVQVESEWETDEARIQYLSYQVEEDERAKAYLAIPKGPVPAEGFPGVVCLHGTINWGARQTLGLPPEESDPHADRLPKAAGKDFARHLVRRGYATISPEHFCAGSRMPPEGPFETGPFYRKHPGWTAVGKAAYEHKIACTLLGRQPGVDADRLGVTGHSLGAHGTIFLGAYDERIRCVAPNCAARTFRANSDPLAWSRDRWYVYFPQLREEFLAGRQVQCDMHEIIGLIAPRPFLDRIALRDGDPMGQNHRVMMHLRLRELYRLLGAEEAHAFLVIGDGHSIPALSREAFLSWMDRWLKYDGDPQCGAFFA